MHPNPIKSIVLIDDDPIANMISTKLIQRTLPLKVLAFTNAEEALRLVCSKHPEPLTSKALIFLDINMPHMDGWQFLDEFQKLESSVQKNFTIIMLTSSIDMDDIQKSKSYDCVDDFISKPLTQEKLRSILN